MHLEGETLVNLISAPLPFNALDGKILANSDNRQIRQSFLCQNFALQGMWEKIFMAFTDFW